MEPILYTSEFLGRMGTSFGCSDFWGRLGEQALIMIGRWYPKATINQSEVRFVHPNDHRIIAPKAFTHLIFDNF